jgi:hypothetical protein
MKPVGTEALNLGGAREDGILAATALGCCIARAAELIRAGYSVEIRSAAPPAS